VVGRGHELQHNSFFDTRDGALAREHVGFRRRSVEGEKLARWSIKGDSEHVGGVATRAEIELALEPDMPPALALSTLRSAAGSRGAPALAEAIDAALASGGLPPPQPFVETETDRRLVDLSARHGDWLVELALDRMRIVGHDYAEEEIEAELKHGDEDALSAAREAIEAMGPVRESQGSKLSRAAAHVRDCDCSRRVE
jgi:inorganic triphosphatase YgiF